MIMPQSKLSGSTDPVAGHLDRYAVVGHPVAHSKSPAIHAAFAAQTAQALHYERLLAPLDGFAQTVTHFFAAGGKGINVTVPFKLEAVALADVLTPRAQSAGAVNTMWRDAAGLHGDNTDGVGLVRDIERNAGTVLTGRRILLLGAGGAARGALLPLIERGPACVSIANRTADKAAALIGGFAAAAQRHGCTLWGGGYDELGADAAFDIIINATAASLHAELPPVPPTIFAADALAYDMMYAAQPTVFMQFAASHGVHVRDGLGMLVEQAAEAFLIWRGVLPDSAPVLADIRAMLDREAQAADQPH